jgi:hypothetical protein
MEALVYFWPTFVIIVVLRIPSPQLPLKIGWKASVITIVDEDTLGF